MELELNPVAVELKQFVDNNEDFDYEDMPISQAAQNLHVCMGSENFGYALFDGGYLIPSEWVQGESLVKLEEAVKLVKQFKDIVEKYHAEF